ncbi:MAG: phage holin family protein [Chloroflexota bacterium]|nr:phage holin family protein [Chloroflexota bacterium]
MGLIVRLVVNAVALWVAAQLVPGIGFGGAGQDAIATILIVALIFGLVNALIKPILAFVTCPFYIITLGLFTFIVNALMLMLTSAIAQALDQPFFVDGFIPALIGSIIISIVSFILNVFVGDEARQRRRKRRR